jgi:hypothetical protein
MSWLDDFVGWASGSGADDALTDIGSDVNVSDIVSGSDNLLGDAYQSNNGNPMYGSDSPNEPIKPSYNGYTTGDGYTNGYDNSGLNEANPDAPKSLSAKSDASEEKGLFGQTANFIDKNKKLTDIGLGLIGGAYTSGQKKKEDNKAYDRKMEDRDHQDKMQKEKEDRADARAAANRAGNSSAALEMLATKDALEQAKNARYSASITGLKPQGLINKGKKLTYVGGKPVYTDGNLT